MVASESKYYQGRSKVQAQKNYKSYSMINVLTTVVFPSVVTMTVRKKKVRHFKFDYIYSVTKLFQQSIRRDTVKTTIKHSTRTVVKVLVLEVGN